VEDDLLFQDVAANYPGLISPEQIARLQARVALANGARAVDNLNARENQYDKSEVLLTWYSFAPLRRHDDARLAEVLVDLVRLGLQPDRRGGVPADPALLDIRPEKPVHIQLEHPVPAPHAYLEDQAADAVAMHPVRYIRLRGEQHLVENLPLESETRFDAWVQIGREVVVGVEAKLTSDADEATTYNATRNQIIRGIDAGFAQVAGPSRFVYLLLVPKQLYAPRKRWFTYLLQQYAAHPEAVTEDLPHRQDVGAAIAGSVGCLFWEDLRGAVLQAPLSEYEHIK
jgi:hypothetical protein